VTANGFERADAFRHALKEGRRSPRTTAQKSPTPVDSLKLKETRVSIPTENLRDTWRLGAFR